MAAMDGAGPPGISPPEGVEWSNRWAELENGYACLELHRDKLQKEVEELRKSLHAKMQAPPEGLEAELRSKILEMQEEADLRLSEEVRKEEKIARLASELERQTLRLGEMSQAKFQLEYEKSRTESEVLPLTTARDRLQQEKEAKEQIIHDLRQELASARDEQEKLFREKFDLARELRRELEAAKSEASFQQKLATEATEAQFRERKLKEDLERKLKTAQEDAALERSALEEKCRLRQEQLDRTNECWKQTQAELNDSVEGLQAACQATEGAAEELKSLKAELEEQRRQYQGLKAEHEDFLRRRVPGAETGELPTGFESISELVRIAHTSREEALQERAAKEHLQQVLQDIEREIRQRYPVLMSQNQELHELRRQNGELREQNKIILQKAREYATYNRDAEARAQRSERSLRMLEGHAQDLTKQLAVLLYEKNRRENANLAASNLTFFSLSKDEDDKWPLSNVEEVVEQNVALRKALRHLEAKCEDVSSKVELEDREQQFEEELEKKSKELKELVSQLQEVQDALEEATHDRDAAVKKVKTLEAGIVPGNAPTSRGEAPQDDRELLRVKREREDLAERCQALQTQLSELRAAKAQAEKEESVGRARLEYERQLRRDLEESSKQLQREKKELTDRLNQQSKLAEDLREEKRHEEAKLRGTLSALKDVKAAQGNAESLLQAEELKIRELEKSQSLLLSEKQLLEREVANLQSRMSQERESLKQELQDQYKKQEHLFSAMSRKSEEDFARLQATLLAARDSEALQAKKHAEEQLAKLEAKLALLERPRAKLGDVAAEAEAQLEKSEEALSRPVKHIEDRGDARRLLQQLQAAEEREEQHRKTVETWREILAQQAAELRGATTQQERLEEEIKELKGLLATERQQLSEESQREKARAQDLDQQLAEIRSQAVTLKGQLDAANVELETNRLDWEQKLRDSGTENGKLEREKKELQEAALKAEQKYQEEVKLHASDAKELSSAQQRLLDLERGSQQLKLRQQDLVSEAEHAREERAEELISLRRRMEQAEEHARRLAEENSRYREQMVDFGRAVEGDAVREQVLAEMKKAREIGELERHRLELQKTQAAEDGKALRSENQRLREQLAKEQRENWRLQKDCKLEQQSRAKLLQIDMIEDENCRLESENKALKEKLEDALKAADLSTNPLAKQLEEERKRREELEADRNFQKGRSEEWQSMYEGCKFKQSDIEKWEAQSAELNTKVTSLQESITSTQAELEKERSKVEGLTKDRDKTLTTLKTKEKEFDKQVSQLKAVQNLKELHTKRIQDLEAQTEQLKGDNERLKKEKGDKSDKMPAEDLLKAQKNADLAIHLAMEYWRALDAVLPEVEARAESAAPKEPAQAAQAASEGVKRKEPIPLQQLGAAERAPKLSRTDSGGGPPVKKQPAKAPAAISAGAVAPAKAASKEGPAASPLSTPRQAPTRTVVEIEDLEKDSN